MGEFISYILDLLVPPRRTDLLVRALTLEQLQGISGEDGLPYHDPRVTALIWEIKYYGTRRSAKLAGAYISEYILTAASEETGQALLIPVPMHQERRRERGHNQTELLCRSALPHLGTAVAYSPYALSRVRHAPTQQGLPKAERLRNVAGSMAADGNLVQGRACIVVDDVATTGATAAEAARALKAAGARSVHTITLAVSSR